MESIELLKSLQESIIKIMYPSDFPTYDELQNKYIEGQLFHIKAAEVCDDDQTKTGTMELFLYDEYIRWDYGCGVSIRLGDWVRIEIGYAPIEPASKEDFTKIMEKLNSLEQLVLKHEEKLNGINSKAT